MSRFLSSQYWDRIANKLEGKYYFDSQIGKYKSDCILAVVERWLGALNGGIVLKTDLWEEAFGSDQILFHPDFRKTINIGVDISHVVTCKAQRNHSGGNKLHFAVCDVGSLPLKDHSVDVILSTSTLDHFPDIESFSKSVNEISRILKPGGSSILILDNKKYLFRWLIKFKAFLGITPIFIGKTYSAQELDESLKQAKLHRTNATAIVHLPVPVFTSPFRFLSKLLGNWLPSSLFFIERVLEHLPLRSITGMYIAIHAVKQGRM